MFHMDSYKMHHSKHADWLELQREVNSYVTVKCDDWILKSNFNRINLTLKIILSVVIPSAELDLVREWENFASWKND